MLISHFSSSVWVSSCKVGNLKWNIGKQVGFLLSTSTMWISPSLLHRISHRKEGTLHSKTSKSSLPKMLRSELHFFTWYFLYLVFDHIGNMLWSMIKSVCHLPVFRAFKSHRLFYNIVNELWKRRHLNQSWNQPVLLSFCFSLILFFFYKQKTWRLLCFTEIRMSFTWTSPSLAVLPAWARIAFFTSRCFNKFGSFVVSATYSNGSGQCLRGKSLTD